MTNGNEVQDNKAESRFEMRVADETAIAAYENEGGVIRFTHTVVPEALEGQGVGSRLIEAALASARAEGLKVIPQCSFVAAYIARHPESAELAG
ncbi:MAG: hypothetical protein AVDCRST_MAG91-2665 [uncultured Sphingomonadaceae bacterium]|uniref:N-acetyltransferase domain-containing protein n=1 Tax=uncultured Sphingomonadaceae bacterium TaxID=169976 RepID=A0A6J4TPH7_9SPHN|nr:MAG: hypothetical protein AVDCRST_MAG91-2665 [uncultured Sphingomonadaceae bacterium]